jgi:hypothetical protein
MRHTLCATLALFGLATGTAQAQVQNATAGFFGFASGGYLVEGGPGTSFSTGPGLGSQAKPGDGFFLDGKLGYAFGGGWDVAAGGSYAQFSSGDRAGNIAGAFTLDSRKAWTIDAEVGYTINGPGYGVRPAFGVRFLKAIDETNALVLGPTRTRGWGVGPHVGVDAAVQITDSISLVGGVDTAFLFGNVRSTFPAVATTTRDSRMIWQVGGKLGVDWEVVPLFHIVVGYRLNYIDGANYETLARAGVGGAIGRGSVLEHGPFVRMAYNWGAPPAAAAAAPAPSPAVESFTVFFDFDRATLSSTALATIGRAAAQAKAGNKARISVTGHADRAGTEAYNMALSLRRANAVKDQLVREGIPAQQIMVIGKGETEPLVPTADGVREPQNRRVVIVLG